MTMTKYDPVVKTTKNKPVKQVPLVPGEEQLREFVGDVKHLDHIECKRVYDNKFRINVRTRYFKENSVIPTMSIPHSYFIKYVDGEIIDITI